jgi:hypothetical protein
VAQRFTAAITGSFSVPASAAEGDCGEHKVFQQTVWPLRSDGKKWQTAFPRSVSSGRSKLERRANMRVPTLQDFAKPLAQN